MNILIADDDAFSLKLVESTLKKAGHSFISCVDGESAIKAYRESSQLEIAILDWMMMASKSDTTAAIDLHTTRSTTATVVNVLNPAMAPHAAHGKSAIS